MGILRIWPFCAALVKGVSVCSTRMWTWRQIKRSRSYASSRRGAGPLRKDLEAVADAEYHSTTVCEFFDGLHHRRKTRDGAGAQIIAVGKSARQDNGVAIRQIFGLVPMNSTGFRRTLPMA